MFLVLPLFVIAALVAVSQAFGNPKYFIVFLLAAGTLRFGSDLGDVTTAATDLSAIWLLWLILLSATALLTSGALNSKLSLPEVFYSCFLAWCLFEALRANTGMFACAHVSQVALPASCDDPGPERR